MAKKTKSDRESDLWRVSMGAGGRVVIPVAVRDALGFAEGEPLVLTIDDGTARIETYARSVERLRVQVRAMIPPTGDLVDRFLADKRAEAAREDAWVQADSPVERAAE